MACRTSEKYLVVVAVVGVVLECSGVREGGSARPHPFREIKASFVAAPQPLSAQRSLKFCWFLKAFPPDGGAPLSTISIRHPTVDGAP